MLELITFLTTSKYGKYILEAVVVFSLVFGAYKWAEHKGRAAQKDQDEQRQSQEIEKSRKEASDSKDLLIAQANKNAEAADSRAQQAQQQFTVLAQAFSALDAKSKAGADQVGKLKDSELHGDIVSKLGVRNSGDQTPGYTAQEERVIDNDVTQYPIEVQKTSNLSKEVEAKAAEAKSNRELADAKQAAFSADENYIGLLQKFYGEVFNQHPPRYRSASCLFLWKCGKREVKLDPPKRNL